MALRFILGRAGTGKTHNCIRSVIRELTAPTAEVPIILLVPEQATYHTEREILLDPRMNGYHRLNVLSFQRLGYFLAGKNSAKPQLSQIARQMFVHRLLRQHAADLKLLGRSAFYSGTAARLTEVITELYRYDIEPDRLREAAKQSDEELFRHKIADIAYLFEKYNQIVADRFVDPDLQLIRARRQIQGAPFAKGALLFVDGFAGFTACEKMLLAELIKNASQTTIALCLDPKELDLTDPKPPAPDNPFATTIETYIDLYEIIKKCKITISPAVCLDQAHRFSSASCLTHIESHFHPGRYDAVDVDEAVTLISATDPRQECEFIARRIAQLVRTGEIRYHDIAVIVGDIEGYQHYLAASFEDEQIPYFLDRRKPLNNHPLIQLICCALKVVLNDFDSADVFEFLKNDLLNVPPEDIDLLENYCIAYGVDSQDWLAENRWSFHHPDDPAFNENRIDAIRRHATAPLISLYEHVQPDNQDTRPISDMTEAIFHFLQTLEVQAKLQQWTEQASKQQDAATANLHRQVYDRFFDVLDEMNEIFDDQPFLFKDFSDILTAALAQLTVAFIPPTLDQVLIGSIERSRHPNLKVVFLAGATQRQFPTPVTQTSLLTDRQRKRLQSQGVALAPNMAQSMLQRQYLAYIALTRPSQKLYISYPQTDTDGNAAFPSEYLTRLTEIFTNLQIQPIDDILDDLASIHTPQKLSQSLCRALCIDNRDEKSYAAAAELLSSIKDQKDFHNAFELIRRAVDYQNTATLQPSLLNELIAKPLRLSASKLSIFAKCPYQYFARYTLSLDKRKQFKLEPLDLGTFYHEVLAAVIGHLIDRQITWDRLDDDKLTALTNKFITTCISKNTVVKNFREHSRHNAYIIQQASEILIDCILALAQLGRAGKLFPIKTEIKFGTDSKSSLPSLQLCLPNQKTVQLSGVLDRIDKTPNGLAVVYDYKTTSRKMDWTSFYYGLDLQLPVYLSAVQAFSKQLKVKEAVGGFFIPIQAAIETIKSDEYEKSRDKFLYKPRGFFNGQHYQAIDRYVESKQSPYFSFYISKDSRQYGNYKNNDILKPDHFQYILDRTKRIIGELVERMDQGTIEATPYRRGSNTACAQCEFLSVCRFDWQINDYHTIHTQSKTDILTEGGFDV